NASSTSSRSSPGRPSTRAASGPSLGAAPGGPPGGLMGVLIEDLRGEYRSALRRRKDGLARRFGAGGGIRARLSSVLATPHRAPRREVAREARRGARLDTGDGAYLYPRSSNSLRFGPTRPRGRRDVERDQDVNEGAPRAERGKEGK